MTLKICQENVSRRTNQFGTKNKTICLGIYVSKINLFISVTLHNMNINIKNSIYRFNNWPFYFLLRIAYDYINFRKQCIFTLDIEHQ